jgi:hypothetical protein
MINTEVDDDLIRRFRSAGGRRKPCYVEMTVCWAADERRARRTAHEVWSLAGLEGPLFTELALPSHFEAAFKPITEERIAEAVLCGPDPEPHVAALTKADRAGYTHVCVHQVGPDQEGFLRFYEREVLPRLPRVAAAPPRGRRPRRGAAPPRGAAAEIYSFGARFLLWRIR